MKSIIIILFLAIVLIGVLIAKPKIREKVFSSLYNFTIFIILWMAVFFLMLYCLFFGKKRRRNKKPKEKIKLYCQCTKCKNPPFEERDLVAILDSKIYHVSSDCYGEAYSDEMKPLLKPKTMYYKDAVRFIEQEEAANRCLLKYKKQSNN